jgi:hypothetical protein
MQKIWLLGYDGLGFGGRDPSRVGGVDPTVRRLRQLMS